jgi:hypothetical protein
VRAAADAGGATRADPPHRVGVSTGFGEDVLPLDVGIATEA